jgi:gliding motility-associated lipoprotein GldD
LKFAPLNILVSLCIVSAVLSSCDNEKIMSPKPRMYPRIYFPESENLLELDDAGCSFVFTYPDYAEIKKDSFAFEGKPEDECWFDVNIPTLNTSLHCSYHSIKEKATLDKLVNDAFTIAGKHNVKANFRKESLIRNSQNVSGIMFEIEGPVASPIQFYLTDSTKHFFRASLYFNSKVNPDSTAEVLNFVRIDIEKIIESFKWKK